MPIHQDQLIRLLISERARVLAYIRSIVRREDLAEDVFQEVSIRAVNKQAEIEDEVHFQKWVRVAARFEALNAVRKVRVRDLVLEYRVLDELEQEWDRHDGDAAGNDARRADALADCLASLSPAARDIVRQRYEGGRSVTDVAKRLRRPVDSLYVTISRIHRALADCVTRRLAGPEAVRA
ncbi:MAG: hypothetical protein JWO31_3658 [Phycisphaerales bacterium]|nr:hypothetical protein [Phycisphaerales bacterium]